MVVVDRILAAAAVQRLNAATLPLRYYPNLPSKVYANSQDAGQNGAIAGLLGLPLDFIFGTNCNSVGVLGPIGGSNTCASNTYCCQNANAVCVIYLEL